MTQILVYGDSLSWGIIPGTRRRLPFTQRWPAILETCLIRAGHPVRVIEDCLNGRRTVWDDPFKPGRNGLAGIEQRIEVNSPLSLLILMLGTNDFQSVHQHNASHSAQGVASIVRAIRRAPIEPDMPVPTILIVAPPLSETPAGTMADKFAGAQEGAQGLSAAYEGVAAELNCAFFDAGRLITASKVDGVHLDADQHEILGQSARRSGKEVVVSYDELETDRLKLRMWRESDLDDYAALTADPLVMRYLQPGKPPFTRADAWRSIAFFMGHWQMRGYGHWAVEEKASGRMIGRIGFLKPEGWPGFEIGWTLARDSWGKGYATEGGRRALDYAFKDLDQPHVISLIHPENTPSMKVAERLGEKREGTARINDIDVLVYGVVRP